MDRQRTQADSYKALAAAITAAAVHDLAGRDILRSVDALGWLTESEDVIFYLDALGLNLAQEEVIRRQKRREYTKRISTSG